MSTWRRAEPASLTRLSQSRSTACRLTPRSALTRNRRRWRPRRIASGAGAGPSTLTPGNNGAARASARAAKSAASGSLALTLAGDKSLSKKLFEFHGVRSPEFTIISTTGTEGKPSLDKFPLIVKPIASDASIGINAKSVVKTVEELMDRVFAIHQEFHTPALVEE